MANKDLIIESTALSIEEKVIALLACIAQEQRVEMSRLISDTKLSLLQLQLLHELSADGPMTVTQLKNALVDDSPNVSRTLNKLVEAGYVSKERSVQDQRTVFVSITPSGEKAHVEAEKRLVGISTGLTKRELDQLYRLLVKL